MVSRERERRPISLRSRGRLGCRRAGAARSGLGRLLTEQGFAIARERGVRKMIAQMTTDQEAAIFVHADRAGG
jgi:hypothetical protein